MTQSIGVGTTLLSVIVVAILLQYNMHMSGHLKTTAAEESMLGLRSDGNNAVVEVRHVQESAHMDAELTWKVDALQMC